MNRKWTTDEAELMKAFYPIYPKSKLTELLPEYSYSAIKTKARKLNLVKLGKLYSWFYADELKLQELYPDITNVEIGKMFGKTEAAVIGAAFKLQLRKSPEFMRFHTLKTAFKKGAQPANKGKKQTDFMTPDAIARTAATRFGKGHLPHNAIGCKDGDIRIRTDKTKRHYKWIRVAMGKWQMLHVVNWIVQHGPLPKGMIIVFKSGDTMDCALDNLELITKAENMKRNSGAINLPDGMVATYLAGKNHPELIAEYLKYPTLIETKRLQIQLKREIKNATAEPK